MYARDPLTSGPNGVRPARQGRLLVAAIASCLALFLLSSPALADGPSDDAKAAQSQETLVASKTRTLTPNVRVAPYQTAQVPFVVTGLDSAQSATPRAPVRGFAILAATGAGGLALLFFALCLHKRSRSTLR